MLVRNGFVAYALPLDYHAFFLQVREVKGAIEGTNPEFPAAQLKLIHSGQILKDESTLEEYKIKDDEFLVCMVTKVRAQCPNSHGCLEF